MVEFMSPSDTLKDTQDKMKEYIKNGARLGWLIAPGMRRVEIYRPQEAVEILEAPATLSGDDVLPGFILNLSSLW
jgi:Uma2 family endonuclease